MLNHTNKSDIIDSILKNAIDSNDADKNYQKTVKDIDREMKKLHTLLAKHKKNQLKDTEDYGFVGDLGKVFADLVDINDFLK